MGFHCDSYTSPKGDTSNVISEISNFSPIHTDDYGDETKKHCILHFKKWTSWSSTQVDNALLYGKASQHD